jgi:copine 5/8/9
VRNEYLHVIEAVGSILENYDTDKQIPVLGYGAKLPSPFLRVSHTFAINGNIFAPELDGIKGVIQTYQNMLLKISLSGPTYFNHILRYVNDMIQSDGDGTGAGAACSQDQQKYYILLIITDGVIMDMADTIDQIVRGSELPLSILIVGVGDADFDDMDK